MRIELAAGLFGPRLFERTLCFRAAMGEAIFFSANSLLAPFAGFASPAQIDDFAHLSTRAAVPLCSVLIPKFARLGATTNANFESKRQ
jgi:hypothetical protein